MRLPPLLALLLFIVIGASTVAAQPPILVIGSGNLSCGSWLERSTDSDSRLAFTAWIGGFVTSANVFGNLNKAPRIGDGTDMAGLLAWVSKYCQDHPLDKVVAAVTALILELEGS